MIETLQGILALKLPHRVVIENDGIGFEVFIPFSTYKHLRDTGSGVRLLTHLHWRDEGPQLFGFLTEDERTLFRLLLKVNKVGPRLSVNILSAASPDKLVEMILSEDIAGLTGFKGVGAKIAQRLVIELKDQIMKSGLQTGEMPKLVAKSSAIPHEAELREALENLGYSAREIDKALRDVGPELKGHKDLPGILELVLRYFSS